MKQIKIFAFLLAALSALAGVALPARGAAYPRVEWVYRAKPDINDKTIVFPSDDTLVFQTDRFVMHAVAVDTGARRWAYALEDKASILPVPANTSGLKQNLLVAATPSIMHGLDMAGRVRLWSTPVCGGLPRAMGALASGPVLHVLCQDGKTAYLNLADGSDAKNAKYNKAPMAIAPPPPAAFHANLLGDDVELSLQGGTATLKRGQAPDPAWIWKAPSNLARTAALLENRLYLLTQDGLLTALDPATGRKLFDMDLTRAIDMRFWDELPQNVDFYGSGSVFTHGDALFVRGPSFIARIKILPFPDEISLRETESARARKLHLAIMSWDSRAFQAALESFRDVVSEFPDYAPARMFLGMGYSALRETGPEYIDLAIEHLEKARELDPRDPDVDANLLGNYLIKAMTLDPRQNRDTIIDLYHKAQRVAPFSLISYVGLAEIYLGEKDFASAAQVIALSLDYGFMGRDQYLLLLATLYMANDTDAALDIAGRTVKYFPDSRTAFVLKGKLHCKRGEYARAIQAFAAAPSAAADADAGISTFPKLLTAGAGFFYGNALGLSGNYNDAVARLEDFVNNLPSEWQIKQLEEQFQEELSDVQKGTSEAVISISEQFRGRSLVELRADRDFKVPALLSIAHFQLRRGRAADSLKYLKKVEDLKLDDNETRSYLGYFYALNGHELDRALKYTKTAHESSPKDVVFLKNYGVALWKKKQYDQAEQIFKQALALDQPTEFLHYEYAQLLFDMGRKDAALAELKKEHETSPEIALVREAMKKYKLPVQ